MPLLRNWSSNKLTVRQAFDPVHEIHTPLVLLMKFSRPFPSNVGQNFIAHHNRPFLVIARREQLNHLPPVFFHKCLPSLFVFHRLGLSFEILPAVEVQCANGIFQNPQRRRVRSAVFTIGDFVICSVDFIERHQMLVAEIIQCELMFMDAVHGGTTVCDRTHFIGIELFPPVQRASNVDIDNQHPHKLPMVCASIPQPGHEIEVVRSQIETILTARILVLICAINAKGRPKPDIAIAFLPTLQRIPHPTDSMFPTDYLGVLEFKHCFRLS